MIDNFDAAEKDTYEHLKESLTNFYATDTSDVIERHVFNTIVQHQGEGIDAFVTRLRSQAQKCNYKVQSLTRQVRVQGVDNPVPVQIEFRDLTEDRIVVGVKDQQTRSKLLRERSDKKSKFKF